MYWLCGHGQVLGYVPYSIGALGGILLELLKTLHALILVKFPLTSCHVI